MGWGDFVKGAARVGKTVADITTEPIERVGQGLELAGKGVNWTAEQSGKIGDFVEDAAIKAGVPPALAKPINFAFGGATEWVGESVGDAAITSGYLSQHVDTIEKGAISGVSLAARNPKEAAALTEAGISGAASYAQHNPGKIASFVGNAGKDAVTDPVSLALLIGSGGTSALAESGAKAAATAGAEAFAEGGVKAAGKAAARSFAETAAERAGLEAGEATVGQTARQVLKNTFTGRNAPATGALEERLGSFPLSRTPTGRLAQFRNGVAEKVVGEEGGFLRERLANRITAGSGKPTYGGPAAVAQWKAEKLTGTAAKVVKGGNAVRTTAEIAADPAGYAYKKVAEEADSRGIGRGSGYTAPEIHTSNDTWDAPEEDRSMAEDDYREASDTRREIDDLRREVRGGAGVLGGQHFWQGPGSSPFGGIGFGHDWRTVEPLRPIHTPSMRDASEYKRFLKSRTQQRSTDAPTTAAAGAFAPETPKLALEPGARPIGEIGPAKFPEIGSGPVVHFGPEAGRAPGEYSAGSETGDVEPGRFRGSYVDTTATEVNSDLDTTASTWGRTGSSARATGTVRSTDVTGDPRSRTAKRRPAGMNPSMFPVLAADRASNFPIA